MKTNINKYTYKNIPVLEYSNKNAHKLMFLQHGIYGNKEKVMNLLAIRFLKLGYTVVGIDAYKHGARSKHPFNPKDEDHAQLETFEVVKQTVKDLLELYNENYKETYDTFDMVGISMGGLMTYYMSTQTTHLNTMIPLISSPNFMASAYYTFKEEKRKQYQEKSDQALALIKTMDPVTQIDKMRFNKAIIMNGKADQVIPIEQTSDFVDNNPKRPIIYRTYETEHKITQAMTEDLLKLLEDEE